MSLFQRFASLCAKKQGGGGASSVLFRGTGGLLGGAPAFVGSREVLTNNTTRCFGDGARRTATSVAAASAPAAVSAATATTTTTATTTAAFLTPPPPPPVVSSSSWSSSSSPPVPRPPLYYGGAFATVASLATVAAASAYAQQKEPNLTMAESSSSSSRACIHCSHDDATDNDDDTQHAPQEEKEEEGEHSASSKADETSSAAVKTPPDDAAVVLAHSKADNDEEDDDHPSKLPRYISSHFARELDNALDHDEPLDTGTKSLLASNSVMPEEYAKCTLAPQVPPPINRSYPVRLIVDMVTTNKKMNIQGNRKYEYWPFGYYDRKTKKNNYGVPGPFIRARVGDVLQVNFCNLDNSGMAHSIDFHCVYGPGGGSPTTFAEQDETKVGAYHLMKPGLYVYHCAAAPIPVHIHNGMFGLILVEPAEGLPPVDKEFYVMQSELYLEQMEEDPKEYEMDYESATKEVPSHVVFNGRDGALTEKPMIVKQNEKVRIYFGNAGPNLVSSFHVIGGILDKLYREGDVLSPPAKSVQTAMVPAGGSCIVDLKMQVPGSYALVDHSIFRIDKGAVGMIKVKGKPRPDIYDSNEPPAFCPGCKTHQ